jgi:hypothetical protein
MKKNSIYNGTVNKHCLLPVKDSTTTFKKRVLENTEVDVLLSYYNQDGVHSAVNGGIGSEKLSDIQNIVVAVPLNDDDVLTFDVGISAYTSASSSNINPYDESGPLGHLVQLHGKPHLELLEVINSASEL